MRHAKPHPRESAKDLRPLASLSITDLTSLVFGEALTIGEAGRRLGLDELLVQGATRDTQPREDLPTAEPVESASLWVGSIGYERYKDNQLFMGCLSAAGVERLIDVRELPISRRRGYAKSALTAAAADAGIEYVHLRALGNPKQFRDLYKSGDPVAGRAGYERFLLAERRDALAGLVELLDEKPSALMCVEHDHDVCHRKVIFDALQSELGIELSVAKVG
jgi:hypothetical protein